MSRINVYTEDNTPFTVRELVGWFDDARATAYHEAREWDGNNHISLATGSQWEHQVLYRTASGRWVLHCWSQWQGSMPFYGFVNDNEAREWLLRNHVDDAVAEYFGAVEDERGPGRPEIGPAINVRLSREVLTALDAEAAYRGISRAEFVRKAVELELTASGQL